eukprot:gene8723-11785_t
MNDIIDFKIKTLTKAQLRDILSAILSQNLISIDLFNNLIHSFGGQNDNVNIIDRNKVNDSVVENQKVSVPVSGKSPFDMSKYRQRQIAMQVQYDGSSYYGFASQAGECDDTIEKHLFHSLLKLKLIEDRKTCKYSRCGRTDKGVSALGQVVSFTLRSSIPKEVPSNLVPIHPCDEMQWPIIVANESNSASKVVKEVDYCSMMNRTLPDNIRVIGWSEVTDEFSSRFSAVNRTYRYFFIKKHLDTDAMQEAANHLIGKHDFRNLCKLDVTNVSNFQREIYSAKIIPFLELPSDSLVERLNLIGDESIWMFEITGIAFLWHMVRCIVAVLFLVGEKLESPDIFTSLFDIDNCPSKPSYAMAPEQPLVLHECGFENLTLGLQPHVLWNLTAHYEAIQNKHLIAAARAANSLRYLAQSQVRTCDVNKFMASLLDRQGNGGNGKRKFDSQVTSKNEDTMELSSNNGVELSCQWSEVVRSIYERMNQYPKDMTNTGPYIPLMKRKKEESYQEKVNHLMGNKKERYEKHAEQTGKAAQENPEFFKIMRQQGSKLG